MGIPPVPSSDCHSCDGADYWCLVHRWRIPYRHVTDSLEYGSLIRTRINVEIASSSFCRRIARGSWVRLLRRPSAEGLLAMTRRASSVLPFNGEVWESFRGKVDGHVVGASAVVFENIPKAAY